MADIFANKTAKASRNEGLETQRRERLKSQTDMIVNRLNNLIITQDIRGSGSMFINDVMNPNGT